MNQITFSKLALIVCLLCAAMIFLSIKTFAQDTIPVNKVLVLNRLINIKNGKIMRQWWRKTKVKKGYIIRLSDSTYVINDKIMIPNNFSYQVVKK